MKYIALKELPQGQQPGEEFETTEAMGDVLILVGAAKRADTDGARRRYQRKDLQATETGE
jgi:hypothetical protein